ncbi:MAG: 3-oxoacyl-ACP reductase family protein [Anaerolineales bacterium]|jgi:3-oxoacyl-[acyl-carrier protein] reductase|nr:3-oxoacyl-ACP reductase family protein [Anaerolineales bacterium]|tara:strand:+ start:59 stop:814 length:756 start_codon:yes stop_codon:yes gene_type:complete
MRLKNLVIIVTGSGQGIGRVFALRLAEEGARVVVAEINAANAHAVADEITKQGNQALAVPTDVSIPESALAMARLTVETYGRIDVLVNNAAIYYGLQMKPFDQIDPDEWRRLMAVNVDGLFYCARAVIPYMREQGNGRIINITSGSFHLPVPGIAHYITSKGAVIGFTRALACELGEYGITVNAIAPGFTMSDASKVLAGPELAEAIASRQCIKRSEQPEDLVGALVWLTSDDSAFFTGQTMTVDGGTSFH